MKTPIIFTAFYSSILASTVLAGEGPASIDTNPGNFLKKPKGIEFFLNGRLRAEAADLDARPGTGSVVSLRNRFGIKTQEFSGFKFLAEGEHTYILSNTSDYSAFPGTGNRSIIADPDNFDLNRLQVSYTRNNTSITLGRQYILHSDQRFIGAVGWRQNDQTFDGVSLRNTSIENLTLQYSYANQVNRIFGTQAPDGSLERWHGDVHLFKADYAGLEAGDLSAFAYLLDFENAAAASSNTYGMEWKGNLDLAAQKINYLVTGALQTDAGANSDYQEYYLRVQADTKFGGLTTGLGMERMTGDGTHAFVFPLGTNHKFNGYADAFLTTPASGLRDYYGWISTTCPLGVNHKLAAHHFSTDEGNHYLGYEIDYVAKRKLTDSTSILFKAAHLEGHGSLKSAQRASVELNYSF